jgi:hypothetical protein
MLLLLGVSAARTNFAFDEHTFFFAPGLVRAGGSVRASFPGAGGQCVFLWRPQNPESDLALSINVTTSSGATFASNVALDSGVRAVGCVIALNFSHDVFLQLWAVPDGLCPGPVLFYSSPSGFSDDLRPAGATSLCAFFGATNIDVAVSGKSGARFFRHADLRAPAMTCETVAGCTFASDGHMLLSLQPLQPPDHIALTVAARGPPNREPCTRSFVPLLAESGLDTTEMPLDPLSRMSCHLAQQSLPSPLIVFGVVCLGLSGVALIVLFGWCARIRHQLVVFTSGGKDINRDIDPKQLLREDQIQHLVSVVPEGEEEDAGEA